MGYRIRLGKSFPGKARVRYLFGWRGGDGRAFAKRAGDFFVNQGPGRAFSVVELS
jgi:hypothetical protein